MGQAGFWLLRLDKPSNFALIRVIRKQGPHADVVVHCFTVF